MHQTTPVPMMRVKKYEMSTNEYCEAVKKWSSQGFGALIQIEG
jgi:hypothetical protein